MDSSETKRSSKIRIFFIVSSLLVALTAVLLPVFLLLAPVKVSVELTMLTVAPTDSSDGPSLFLGPLGSCSRRTNNVNLNCTRVAASLVPHYDQTALPDNARLLFPPHAAVTWFLIFGLALSFVFSFTVMFQVVSFRRMFVPTFVRWSPWFGGGSLILGESGIPFLILLQWFDQAVSNFNQDISADGSAGPHLRAKVGHAFPLVWVAYAIQACQLLLSVALHFMPGKGNKADVENVENVENVEDSFAPLNSFIGERKTSKQ
ncbi:hypothetical protein GGX14DRAFT_350444 [Mycena pura]|uniref:Uncharacterized protein n=1 Tax=Mycena pura TaxID=153505 RepID=A0AAD6YMK6_9AGAR|nr:hypothetical protein GGX14DRAFT_350444 [Mycena pura]